MTIAELGAIGEFVGSFAVLATLIYLAAQIKHSQKFAMAQAYQARTEIAFQQALAQDPVILAKLQPENSKGLGGYAFDPARLEDLTHAERVRVGQVTLAGITAIDNVLYQQELGLIPRDYVSPGSPPGEMIRNSLATWQRLGIAIPPRVQVLVDQILAAERAD